MTNILYKMNASNISTMNMHSNSLSTNRIAVVDLGYDGRKISADGHLIVHDILHKKVEYPACL